MKMYLQLVSAQYQSLPSKIAPLFKDGFRNDALMQYIVKQATDRLPRETDQPSTIWLPQRLFVIVFSPSSVHSD